MAPTSSYSVRGAALADAAEIARLASQLGYPANASEILGRLELLLHRPSHFISVAADEASPRLLGWIAAEARNFLILTERVEIMGLVVDSEARRQGVGEALVGEAEHWARNRRVTGIVVRSNIVRPESHPFYERLGYQREKSQHVYLKHLC